MEVAAIAGDKLTRRITPISALSQKPKSETIPVMSAVPPEADVPAAKKRLRHRSGALPPKYHLTHLFSLCSPSSKRRSSSQSRLATG
jgi:hypothetical protein